MDIDENFLREIIKIGYIYADVILTLEEIEPGINNPITVWLNYSKKHNLDTVDDDTLLILGKSFITGYISRTKEIL